MSLISLSEVLLDQIQDSDSLSWDLGFKYLILQNQLFYNILKLFILSITNIKIELITNGF